MLKVLDLFSGIGGFSLGLEWTGGFETVAFCEIDEYCRKVLHKHWPKVPIITDVRDERVKEIEADVITGGFPCQPVSVAGKRRGAEDDRWLWPEMLEVISAVRPAWVIGENVAGIIKMGLDGVLADLEGEGYTTRTFIIPACGVGAPHRRNRVWILAHTNSDRARERHECDSIPGNTGEIQCWGNKKGSQNQSTNIDNGNQDVVDVAGVGSLDLSKRLWAELAKSQTKSGFQKGWAVEPDVGGTLDGFSPWLDRHQRLIIQSHKRIMAYVTNKEGGISDETQEGTEKTLRTLRNIIGTESLQWQIRGLFSIPAQAVLFAYLCQLSNISVDEARIQLEGKKTFGGCLRSLRTSDKSDGTPHRPRDKPQQTGQHSDTLQTLSRLLALDSEKAWTAYRWSDAASLLNWESGIARVADGVPNRVDRLRALGNAVVPQVVEQIGYAILQAEE